MPNQGRLIVDELEYDPEARSVTGPLEGLTEPQWVTDVLATGPLSVKQVQAAISASRKQARDVLVSAPAQSASPRPAQGGHSTNVSTTSALKTSAKISARRLSDTAVNMRIVGAILTLASGTVAARALGVFNQSIISAHFGAGAAMDAYFATLALPVLLTNLIVNALQSSIIPVYVRMTKDGREREASEVLSTILNLALLLVCLLTVLMFVFPKQAVWIMAPGASETLIDAGAQLAPYIFPILLFNTIVGFLTGISNATRRFGFAAFGAMLVPVGIFLGTVLLGNMLGVRALAIGLLVGTLLQFLMMLVSTRRLQLHYRPTLRFDYPEVRTALTQFLPMIAGAAIGQANPVLDQIIASMLGDGNISALNYALKVISIPITVIFVAYSQAVYPYFSSQAAARDYQSLKSTLRLFLWSVGIVTLGMALAFTIFSGPIVDILFRHGAFSASAAQLTSATLIGFSVGLVPMAAEFMLKRTFNALQRNDLLLPVSAYTMITNIALDILLGHFFGLPGIALATSIDYLLTAILMLALLRGLIGRIGLLHPPEQLRDVRRLASLGGRLRQVPLVRKWKIESLGDSPLRVLRSLLLALATFAGMGVATALNAVQGLRLSVGAVLGVLFLRSPLGLLLTWGALGACYSIYVFDHSLGYVLALGSLPAFGLLIWREIRQRRRWPLGIWAYALFLVWVLLGVQLSPLSHSQFAIYWLGDLDYGLLVVLVIAMLTTPRRLERFVSAVLCTATLLALLGIAEYVLRFGGFQQPDARFVYRVSGIFGWSNSFGFYLSLVFPLALYRVLTARRERRLAWGLGLGVILCALVLTFSRTALVDIALVVIVAAPLLGRRIRRALLIGVAGSVVIIGALLLIPGLGIQGRLLQNVTTLNARTAAWQALLARVHLTAPFGEGMYASIDLLDRLRPGGVGAPHSLFLQVLFDHGIIGLLFLLASFALLIGGIVRRALRSRGNGRILMALAAGGLVGGLVYASLDNAFWDYSVGTYFWLLAGLPYARVFAVHFLAAQPSRDVTAGGVARHAADRGVPAVPAKSAGQ